MRQLIRPFALVIGLVALVALALGGLPIRAVYAQDPQPTPSDNDVNRVARDLYCPVCENIPLDVCPTPACHEWRELIRQKLAEGLNDQQIREFFALQYGDRVLSEPPRSGLNWLVYLLPPLALVAGGVVLFGVLRRMRKAGNSSGSHVTPLPTANLDEEGDGTVVQNEVEDEYLTRVEEELRRKESQR